MIKNTLIIFSIIWSFSCSHQKKTETFSGNTNRNYKIHNDFKKHFDNCGVEGTIAIFDKNNNEWILSDTQNVLTESLPASTFKIIHLLIALETKTIKDENEIVEWVGKTDTVKYGYRPEIYHNMSIKEAFEVSAGWVFIELAKKIGKDNYKKYLKACNYGNLNLSEKNDDFWNFGNFGISPMNQVEFIKDLYEEKLPFSKRNMDIVKKVMTTEKTSNYTIRAKTGWTRENNMNTGWWIGYIEANKNTYFFATRLLQARKNNRNDFGSCRKEITKNIFNDLSVLREDNFIKSDSIFNSIDHIPIVVKDIEKIKDLFKNQLFFTIKEGKIHKGIKNFFVKFENGTYLEFIEPVDNTIAIGKYYDDFLKKRQGATSMAVSITNAALVKSTLQQNKTPFTVDSNPIWQTIEPQNMDLFFIKYANQDWKENNKYTTHKNTATSLKSTYRLCTDIEKEAIKYKTLGFTEIEKRKYLDTPSILFKVGPSSFYLLGGTNSTKANRLYNKNNFEGICGFEIKLNSLKTFNKIILQNDNVKYEKDKTTIYFNDYIFFIIFTD